MISSEGQAKAWLRTLPEVDASAWDRLERLVGLLREENARQNLVSIASLAEVWLRHVCDSAQLLRFVPRGTTPWLDLGTGAGFPGLVIAALRPECEIVMVESRARRADWLERALSQLGLSKARVLGSRLEVAQPLMAQVISARAFAPLPKLVALAERFSTSDTLWLLPKGRSAAQELDQLSGWSHMFHVEQSLTEDHAGIIVGTLAGRNT